MEAPTINHVYAAIDTLYHTEGVQGKEEASKWLDQFQRSVSSSYDVLLYCCIYYKLFSYNLLLDIIPTLLLYYL